jgi:hypothetical protein
MTIFTKLHTFERDVVSKFHNIEGSLVKHVTTDLNEVKQITKHGLSDTEKVFNAMRSDGRIVINKLGQAEHGIEGILKSTKGTIVSLESGVSSLSSEIPFLIPLMMVGGLYILSQR